VSDEQIETIETTVRELIEVHLSEKHRQVALAWLEERVAAHRAMIELRLLDKKGPAGPKTGRKRRI
jgi:hypothetical protein